MPVLAFTLIELLIALSILTVLIALLLPAMARARGAAQLTGCLNNLHQIMIATTAYSDENGDELPFPRPRSMEYLDNYGFGGRYTTSRTLIASDSILLPYQRPLNRFLHPEWKSSAKPQLKRDFMNPKKHNLPLFECPADDSFNYTERSRDTNTQPNYTQSAYYTTGTSYAFNASWYGTDNFFRYSDIAHLLGWQSGLRMFKRSRWTYPSRFVSYADEPGNFAAVTRQHPEVAHHGQPGMYTFTYMDGHAALVKFNRGQPFNQKHTLLFLEQRRRDPGN